MVSPVKDAKHATPAGPLPLGNTVDECYEMSVGDEDGGLGYLDFMQRVDWVRLSVIVLTFYQYILTASEEVHFVWGQRLSGATVIYLSNRYTVLSSIVLMAVSTFIYSESAEVCKVGTTVSVALLNFAQLIQGAFAALRTYAIREHSVIPAAVIFVLHFAAFVMRMEWIALSKAMTNAPHNGCRMNQTNGYFDRILLMVADTLLLIVTYMKTCSIIRYVKRTRIQVPTTMLIFRNGTACFSVAFFLGVVDLGFIASGNLVLSSAVSPLIIILRSFIVGSFLVDLREVYSGRDEGSITETFACVCVGNIGAPVRLPAAFDDVDAATSCRSLDTLTTGLVSTGRLGVQDSESVSSNGVDQAEIYADLAIAML